MRVIIDLETKKIIDTAPKALLEEDGVIANNPNYIIAEIQDALLGFKKDAEDENIEYPVFRDTTDLELQPYLLDQMNKDYETQVSQLTSTIPQSEIATWSKQESEAKAYLLDNTASTPLIDAICEARGVTKDYLVSKIIEKADAYVIAIGTLTGQRQKLEKEIKGE